MARLFFKGGVHPPERKTTAPLPIETVPIPGLAVIPLQQHLGKPAKPVVKKKDKVLRGQVVGEADGFVSANIHATVSGTVKTVEPRRHPVGAYVESVVIESDGEDAPAEFTPLDPEAATPDDIRARVRDAGIVGMGGAAFPTAVKITPPKEKPIETLILNGCECEPYLTADHRLMLDEGEKIVRGASLLLKVLGATRWLIAIEDNKPDAIEAMQRLAPSMGGEVVALHVKYPQGAEKQLIKAVLGREVPSGGLPMDVKVVVQNVGSAAAVFDAVAHGAPLLQRVLTVTGEGIARKKNLMARIGTPFQDIVDFCGGMKEDVFKVLMGGPMMGMAQFTLDVPVVKGTSGILFLTRDEAGDPGLQPCLRCGKCVDACPMGLVPAEISKSVMKGLFDRAEDLDVLDCIECGCCAYTCPAHRYLVQNIKRGKAEVHARRKN
ncbi:MAG: electron transport complex subunit RsxC [Planctomycetota bacterium]|jgi:electron transport complex protein RnfC